MSNATPAQQGETKPTFEECSEEIINIIARRKAGWTYLSLKSWDEVRQDLLTRVWKKWGTYQPSRAPKLENWVNRIITNEFHNLRRDLYLRYAKPCIGGGKTNGKSCFYNLGGNTCGAPWVKSKVQCEECPLYAEWVRERQPQFNIQSNVSLENHSQEVSNIQRDFTDIHAIEQDLHAKMLKELTQWERLTYKLLFVKHLTPSETAKQLERAAQTRKRPLKHDEGCDYNYVIVQQRIFKAMMFEHLRRDGYDLKLFLPPSKR